MSAPLRILTRGSKLALDQAGRVQRRLAGIGLGSELTVVRSEGDQDRTTPLSAMGGVGVFTKALQEALLAGKGDLAVHSLKDLPGADVPGLALAATPEREAVEDVLITRDGRGVEDLPRGARVGTGSPRRRAFLAARRPDLVLVDLRGNVETRLKKALDGELDAVVLAAAGLTRLGLLDSRAVRLDPGWMVPAAGQGILGLEARAGSSVAQALAALSDPAVRAQADAERAVLRELAAGCTTPIGVLARGRPGALVLVARLALPGGSIVEARSEGAEPLALARDVAGQLRAGGYGASEGAR